MSDPEDLNEAARAELRGLIAAGIGLAESAEALASRIAASEDPVLADREYKVRLPAQEELDGYLRNLHAVLAAADGRNPFATSWDYDQAVARADPGGGDPTSAELRDLAQAAHTLIERTKAAISVHPGLVLSGAIEYLGSFADAMTRVEDTLLRREAGQADDCCAMPWGVCPEHGNTLRSSGGECWCRHPDCDLRWTYDRADTACLETATDEITDPTGQSLRVCPQHAADALSRIDGATRRPLGESGDTAAPA